MHSRGVYYSSLSENYIKSKRSLKRKVLVTKIFYAVIFGILPIIPLFVYFEYIARLSSGLYDIELVIFYVSIVYGIFFLLQFFNFLLMTIIETMGILSSESIEWFKTLPLSKTKLKRITYITIFRNFDIPIIVILLAFPITVFIGTANLLLFIISLGISFINTFLGLNFIVIISERLNRILKIHSISSKKTFFIRLFNVFLYVFLILGSIYIIQWASTLIPEFFELFMNVEEPELINIILSIISYPLSQSYLIALIISPSVINFPLWISTSIGIGLLILIFYLSYQGALKSIKKVLYSEPLLKQKQIYIEELKRSIKLKPKSAFRACLRKDMLSISRDLKMFLSIILPIILSFIFVIYLNVPSFDPNEPLGLQIFRVWMGFVLISPMLSGILVFNLLGLEESGQTLLESLPIIPRDQAKAKLLIMFVVLTLAILLPSLLFIYSSRFLLVFLGITYSLPFAWLYLFLSFELRILFYGKRNKSYVVGDVLIGSTEFKWITIFVIPLSISVWIISIITLLYTFANPFDLYFPGFIGIVLIGGFIFIIILFKKLFPKIYLHKRISKLEKCQTFFTRHVWVSIILILLINFIFSYISTILSSLIRSFIPPPLFWFYRYEVNIIEYIHYASFLLTPFITFTLTFGFMYFFLIPKIFGVHPNHRKREYAVSDDLEYDWMKYFRLIIYGLLITIFIDLVFIDVFYESFRDYLSYTMFFLIYSLNAGFWLEIIYRGVILNLLTTRYEKKHAILFHLNIVYIYSFLIPIFLNRFAYTPVLMPMYFDFFIYFPYYLYAPQTLMAYILRSGLYLIYSLFMSYIFIKSKKILPNLFISLLFSFLYLTLLFGPIFPIPYYNG